MKTTLLRSTSLLCFCLLADVSLAQFGGTTTGTTTGGAAGATAAGGSIAAGGGGLSGLVVPSGGSTAAQTFVGSNQTQTFIGATSAAGGQGGRTNRQFQAVQNTQTTNRGGSTTTGTPRAIRSALRVSFDFPQPEQSNIGRAAANRVSLQRFLLRRPELAGVTLQQESNGVVILTGEVEDAETRRLAAGLIRLQPGVRGVMNQLSLAGP